MAPQPDFSLWNVPCLERITTISSPASSTTTSSNPFMECALFRKDYDVPKRIRGIIIFVIFMECALFRKDYDTEVSASGFITTLILHPFMECALFRKDYDCPCLKKRFSFNLACYSLWNVPCLERITTYTKLSACIARFETTLYGMCLV